MIVLGSSSPRRKEILKNLGYDFIVDKSNVDESKIKTPFIKYKRCLKLASLKAIDVYKRHLNDLVIGSDTIVVLNNHIYEKPIDSDDAFNMLSKLSNKTHYVYTAVCIIYNNKQYKFIDRASVKFKKLDEKIIKKYIETKEPFDKAGGYGYQGEGSKLIEKIKGDPNTIIGLPSIKLVKYLNKLHI